MAWTMFLTLNLISQTQERDLASVNVISYRIWPRKPPCWSGSTNHDSANCVSGQFPFYHEKEAIHCDKCSDDETPGWNVPGWQRHCDESVHKSSIRIIGQYDVMIASGWCIDDITITHPFSFEIVSGPNRNEWYDFRIFKVTWRFKIQMNSGIIQWWIPPEAELRSVIPCFFQVSWQKDSVTPYTRQQVLERDSNWNSVQSTNLHLCNLLNQAENKSMPSRLIDPWRPYGCDVKHMWGNGTVPIAVAPVFGGVLTFIWFCYMIDATITSNDDGDRRNIAIPFMTNHDCNCAVS